MVRTKDVVLMATVSSYEGMSQHGRHELKQFAELFEPVFKASSLEARRNAIAALSRCAVVPKPVIQFIAAQPIGLAAIFLTRSPAIDDDMLISIARSHGPLHARAVAARENLSVKVVDALVSLHQGQEGGFRPLELDVSEAPLAPVEDREELLREQLKSLVQRDTLERAEASPEGQQDQREALLVRFARLREIRNFSYTLADALGSSRWLTDRILHDLSGVQLATALIAMDVAWQDGEFMLGQLYPHLGQFVDGVSRAGTLWAGLDPEQCAERVRSWIRADDYTQGKVPTTENLPITMPQTFRQ